MSERAADGAVHLRHAAQTVGILHARIAVEMGLPDFALAQKLAKMFRHRQLARMWTRAMNARIERSGRSFQCFQTHRAGDVRDAAEAFRPKQSEPADRVHR